MYVPPLAGPNTLLAGPWTLLDGRIDLWIDLPTYLPKFLLNLQDFVSCQGRCSATLWDFTISKKQGKGTADLMTPFGVLSYSFKTS